jgi:hypothetical protein
MQNFPASILFALSCAMAASALHGQLPPTANQNMVTEFTGKLKGFQRGILLVTRDDDTEMLVQLPEDASAFQFIADAKPAFLQRGAMVRFNTDFNQLGVAVSPVTRVEIFQPISGKIPGHDRQNYIPGVHSDRHAEGQPPQPVATYRVVGGLMGLDASGVMMVQAGQQPVRVQLAPDTKFEIRFNTLALAQEGDPVSVAGFYQPPDETKVKADRVTITTDRVYGEPAAEAEPSSRRRTRRSSRTAAEAGAPADGEARPTVPAPVDP